MRLFLVCMMGCCAAGALASCGGDDSSSQQAPNDAGGNQDTAPSKADTGAAPDSGGGPDASDASQPDTSVAPPPGNTVQGVISRPKGSPLVASGKGKIWVDVGPTCPYSMTFTSAQTISLANIDMSNASTTVPYSMTSVPAGTYYVWGWLDETGSTPPSTPFPNHALGDTVCPMVTVSNSLGAEADLVFTTIIN